MNPSTVLRILKSLDPMHDTDGICAQFFWARDNNRKPISRLYPRYEETLEKWPHYSGDLSYPIPDPTGVLGPYDVFALKPWSPEYKALRKDLLDHLIRSREAYIAQSESDSPTK